MVASFLPKLLRGLPRPSGPLPAVLWVAAGLSAMGRSAVGPGVCAGERHCTPGTSLVQLARSTVERRTASEQPAGLLGDDIFIPPEHSVAWVDAGHGAVPARTPGVPALFDIAGISAAAPAKADAGNLAVDSQPLRSPPRPLAIDVVAAASGGDLALLALLANVAAGQAEKAKPALPAGMPMVEPLFRDLPVGSTELATPSVQTLMELSDVPSAETKAGSTTAEKPVTKEAEKTETTDENVVADKPLRKKEVKTTAGVAETLEDWSGLAGPERRVQGLILFAMLGIYICMVIGSCIFLAASKPSKI